MERLQEALSRARDRREKASQGMSQRARTESAPTPRRQSGSVERAWRDLETFVPDENLMRENRLVSYFGNHAAAPFDMMRTKFIQQIKTHQWRRIAITSPSPRCGKTTVAANLAFSLARQHELRTLLLEVDLRRPELARMLGVQKDVAFSEVLSGAAPAAHHMLRYGDNLAISASNAPAANSAELLRSTHARGILTELEETFQPDIVLFDTAPLMGSDDTMGFLEFTDAALLVAAAEQTTIHEVDIAESEIASVTNVLGVVMNKCRISADGQRNEYGYGY